MKSITFFQPTGYNQDQDDPENINEPRPPISTPPPPTHPDDPEAPEAPI